MCQLNDWKYLMHKTQHSEIITTDKTKITQLRHSKIIDVLFSLSMGIISCNCKTGCSILSITSFAPQLQRAQKEPALFTPDSNTRDSSPSNMQKSMFVFLTIVVTPRSIPFGKHIQFFFSFFRSQVKVRWEACHLSGFDQLLDLLCSFTCVFHIWGKEKKDYFLQKRLLPS